MRSLNEASEHPSSPAPRPRKIQLKTLVPILMKRKMSAPRIPNDDKTRQKLSITKLV